MVRARNVMGLCLACTLVAWEAPCAAPDRVVELWPGAVPGGEMAAFGAESDTTKPSDRLVAGRRVSRIGNVSRPTLSIYPPTAGKATGAAVLVCPGGGYHILAMDLEGTEVCEWLNSMGVTAALLKYRVPKRPGLEKHGPALQDAQRAMSLLRYHSSEWGIDPRRIGVLGFSAGGHLAATLSNQYPSRSYPRVDEADTAGTRPDFALLIYPAYLTVKEKQDAIAPELPISSNTPPTFLVMAQDDPIRVETAIHYALGLHKAGVPFELHIYPKGGHGYGLRPTTDPVTSWPDRAADWLRSCGFLGQQADAGGAIPSLNRDRVERFDWEAEPAGSLSSGWSQHHLGGGTTDWRVLEVKGNKVLAQLKGENPNRHFNLAVFDGLEAKDVMLTVRFRAVAGKEDQGGGLVWRYQDEKNHYIVRANPLEDNVVLYKMVDGVRTDLPLLSRGRTYGLKVKGLDRDWHTLNLVATGDRFKVALDGEELFEVEDATFTKPGKVGLWTKADAVTWFDDLVVEVKDP